MIATRPGVDHLTGEPILPGDVIAKVGNKRWRLVDPRLHGRFYRSLRSGTCPNCDEHRGPVATLRTDAHGRPAWVCGSCSVLLSEDLEFHGDGYHHVPTQPESNATH